MEDQLSTIVSQYATVTCDGPGCSKTVTFLAPDGEAEAIQNNPWLNSLRQIMTVDSRKFSYCSDECEAKGVGTGEHNKKLIVQPQGPNATALAAQAAERAHQATQHLKAGNPVTLS